MNTTTTETTTSTDTTTRRRRRRGLTAASLALALSVTAPLAAGPLAGSASADPLRPAGTVDQLTQDDHGSHLHGKISTADGAPLRLAGQPTLGEHTHAEKDGELPKRIAPGTTGRYAYSSDWGHEADMTFIYAIGDGTWELWTHTNVPAVGPNTIQAEIRRYGQSHADPDSPYNVRAEWDSTSSYNPEPTFTITNKPGEVVTDRVEQADLLTKFCKDGNGACRYVPKSYPVDVTKDAFDVAPPFYNDTKEETEYSYTHGVKIGWENSIAVSGSVEVEIAKVVNLGLKVTYEHTWSTEYTDDRHMSAKVAPGHGVVFRYVPSYAKVTGDFSIFAEGTRYDLKDVNFDFPTGGAYHAVELPPVNH